MSWGRTKGGVICYSGDRTEDRVQARTATQWFQKTGEIWGFDSKPAYEMDEKRQGIATHYLLQCWQRFMRRHSKTFVSYSAEGPFDIELGVTGVEKLYWPQGQFNLGFHPAVEDELVTRAKVQDLDAAAISDIMSQAAIAMRYAFGFEPFADSELKKILEDPSRQ